MQFHKPKASLLFIKFHAVLLSIAVPIGPGWESAARAQESASFQGLGPLGRLRENDLYTLPQAVSPDGTVVAGYSVRYFSEVPIPIVEWEAFRWTQTGGMVGIGDLPGPDCCGGFGSYGYAMSADGNVVVGRGWSDASDTEPFRWTQEMGIVGLGFLGTEVQSAAAYGVSPDGTAVVGYAYNDMRRAEAFRWTQAEGIVGLGDLPGGPINAAAFDASSNGSVVVGTGCIAGNESTGHCSEYRAFRWTASDGIVSLGDLPYGHAKAVSPDGLVIVGSSSSGSATEAFRWTAETGMVGLGDLPGGSFNSNATALSDDGRVIVGSSSTSAGTRPMIWDTAHGMRDLQDLLVNGFLLDLTGWTLPGAASVSADGRTIAGIGLNPSGEQESWRVEFSSRPCRTYADLSPIGVGDCMVELGDLLSMLGGYGDAAACPGCDIFPCGGDGNIELGDLLSMLRAYAGEFDCPHP